MTSPYTVIAVLEAKPGKENVLEEELKSVADCSREEPTNLGFRVHKGFENPQQFILYETWASKQDHEKQFDKPYIKALAEKLDDLMEGPYQGYFAEEIQ